jgi:chromosome condensin MukBEF MukE localization factor
VDRDKTQGLMDEYFARYNEELIRVVKGIDLAQNDYCLECNQSIRNEFYTP